jgi:hypothetical protein
MQHLEVSGAVRHIYTSFGSYGLMEIRHVGAAHMHTAQLGRRMDGLTNLISAFRDYVNAPQNTQKYITVRLPYAPGSTKVLGENTTNLENLEQNSV